MNSSTLHVQFLCDVTHHVAIFSDLSNILLCKSSVMTWGFDIGNDRKIMLK